MSNYYFYSRISQVIKLLSIDGQQVIHGNFRVKKVTSN